MVNERELKMEMLELRRNLMGLESETSQLNKKISALLEKTCGINEMDEKTLIMMEIDEMLSLGGLSEMGKTILKRACYRELSFYSSIDVSDIESVLKNADMAKEVWIRADEGCFNEKFAEKFSAIKGLEGCTGAAAILFSGDWNGAKMMDAHSIVRKVLGSSFGLESPGQCPAGFYYGHDLKLGENEILGVVILALKGDLN